MGDVLEVYSRQQKQYDIQLWSDTAMSKTNPLLQNLVPASSESLPASATSFTDAMTQMGISSVFDIIRQPKQAFVSRLSTLSDANGELAYDNALCYASQIGRSYREEVVSSGRSVSDVSQRSGVRALVDIGPSYPNLFQENWDQFCKVGAIEAMDGPVAYLGSLRRFAEQRIEGASDSPKRIPLSVRRPDLDKLVIDEQSTYQSIPMLELVNRVLTEGIDKYQVEKGDARPVQELLAEKKHPFVFPYHFAHKQVSLALSGDKPALGELNHKLSRTIPFFLPQHNTYTSTGAQQLLSGLSPSLQTLLTVPSLFPTFLIRSQDLQEGAIWSSPVFSTPYPYEGYNPFLTVPEQPGVTCTPTALVASTQGGIGNTLELTLNGAAGTMRIKLDACMQVGTTAKYPVNYRHTTQRGGSQLKLSFDPEKNPGVELNGDYSGTLVVNVNSNVTRHATLAQWCICVDLAVVPRLTPEQRSYLREHYGVDQTTVDTSQLADAGRFCSLTGIDADQLEDLLGCKRGRGTWSRNNVLKHPSSNDPKPRRRPP